MASNDQTLEQLLAELFPAGTTNVDERDHTKPEDERTLRIPHPELAGQFVELSISNADLLEAMKLGPDGFRRFVEDRVVEAAKQAGIEIAMLSVTPNGVVITKGDARIELDPYEAMELAAALRQVIRAQVGDAARRLFGKDGPFGGLI